MAKSNDKKSLPDSSMSLGEHLEELRARLILALLGIGICAVASFFFSPKIINLLEKPYLLVSETDTLQTLGPAEGFISFMKISIVTGLIVASPWVFYQLWMFIAAGLYPHEKKYVHIAAPFSAALFVAGALFFMLVVAPLTIKFLVGFNERILGVKSEFRFQDYIAFVTRLMLVFGLAFQTPCAIFFLNRTNIVSRRALSKSRKYILLAVFVLAAMATPPDVISQVTLAVPLYLLFELGLILCYIFNRPRKK